MYVRKCTSLTAPSLSINSSGLVQRIEMGRVLNNTIVGLFDTVTTETPFLFLPASFSLCFVSHIATHTRRGSCSRKTVSWIIDGTRKGVCGTAGRPWRNGKGLSSVSMAGAFALFAVKRATMCMCGNHVKYSELAHLFRAGASCSLIHGQHFGTL